jgi:hypothetical protein
LKSARPGRCGPGTHLAALCALALSAIGLGVSCGYSPSPANGKQLCGPTGGDQRCVSGYYCADDGNCWIEGTGPGTGAGGHAGMGGASAGGHGGASSGSGGTGVTGAGGGAGLGVTGTGGTGTTGGGGLAGAASGGRAGGTGGQAGTSGVAGTAGHGGTSGQAGTNGVAGTNGKGGAGGAAAPTFTLTITPPTGGSVTDGAGNINCGTVCSHGGYKSADQVTLTAHTSTGYQFGGWTGGGCTGTGTCVLTITADTTVGAVFTQVETLTINVIDDDGCPPAYGASGSATPNSLAACTLTKATAASFEKTCTYQFPSGTAVTVVGQPASGSIFDGPPPLDCGTGVTTTGNCATSSCTCTFTITGNRTVNVYFCNDN